MRGTSGDRLSSVAGKPVLVVQALVVGGAEPAVRAVDLGGEAVTSRDVMLFRRHFGSRALMVNQIKLAVYLARYDLNADGALNISDRAAEVAAQGMTCVN